MNIREDGRRPWREQRAPDEPLSVSFDDQVLTFLECCKVNRISERTGRRILNGSDGPTVTMLSPRRIGITVRANRAWQKSKERAAS
jgi:hypothetical protein